MPSIAFFATAADLLAWLTPVEHSHPLRYARAGHQATGDVAKYDTVADVPDLGVSAAGYHLSDPHYLILDRDGGVRVEHHPEWPRDDKYFVGGGGNPAAASVSFGGAHGDRLLIPGNLSVLSSEPLRLPLYRLLAGELRRQFAKVGGFYYVGPEAYRLLHDGWRLTTSSKSPPDYDLRPPGTPFRPFWETWLEQQANFPATRLTVGQTWDELGHAPRTKGGEPFIPDHTPNAGDEELGFSYFKSGLEGERLDGLSIPRTYFGRSHFELVSFRNTDLSQSRMCWNDWVDCDFTGADLTCCDLRASFFSGCSFAGCVLTGADFRWSTLDGCDFTGATLTGARLTRSQRGWLTLSEGQVRQVNWRDGRGPEPPGG